MDVRATFLQEQIFSSKAKRFVAPAPILVGMGRLLLRRAALQVRHTSSKFAALALPPWPIRTLQLPLIFAHQLDHSITCVFPVGRHLTPLSTL
jgi:hypothetical protein